MIQKLKLAFYIVSAVVLGSLTIFEIYSARQVLIVSNQKELDAELEHVRNVVNQWKTRKPFEANTVSTPSSDLLQNSDTSEDSSRSAGL